MAQVVVVGEPDETPTANAVADAVEATAEAVADAAVEIVEAVTEASADEPPAGALDAVLVENAIDNADRIAQLEAELLELRGDVIDASITANQALGEATLAADEAEEATDPAEVNDMIEATEVVEGDDGELHLDAPDDVPPTGEPHWMFADRTTLWSKIKRTLGMD